MQQYEDGPSEDHQEPTDGALNNGDDVGEGAPRGDKPANSHSTVATTTNAHRAKGTESDDEDFDDDRPANGGGFWRQGASRPPSPGTAMADNASDASSMVPVQRPKSRVELATSRSVPRG